MPPPADDDTLFGGSRAGRGRYLGPVRRGLDADVKSARGAGTVLPAGQLAALRTLADSIDLLRRIVAGPSARPYDHVPVAQLVRQYDDSYARLFAAAAGDPLAAALAAFAQSDSQAQADGDATVGDTAGSVPPD